jgi:hypothetical protein
MKKSYLSWNKDTVKRRDFWASIGLSEGKLNLTQGNEELISTTVYCEQTNEYQ